MINRLLKYQFAFATNFGVFNPKGLIAATQKDLIITAVGLMLLAVVPILIFTAFIVWKYRAGKKSTYTPNVEGNKLVQTSWLILLLVIIVCLATMAWRYTHALDPRQPIQSDVKPITIQAVALEWKWLFIYPEEKIATVNYVSFPKNQPVEFMITADAPMNSFWIPQLGGQMYAMKGMRTKLHLIADEIGEYPGQSSNISGVGFSQMRFKVNVTSAEDFNRWLTEVKNTDKILSIEEYENLAKPNTITNPIYYAYTDSHLFNHIVEKVKYPNHSHD